MRLDFQSSTDGPIYLKSTNVDASMAGPHITYYLSIHKLSSEPQKGAVIIVAGRYKIADRLQTNIHNVTNAVYSLFSAHGYGADDIYYLATDSTLVGYDASATVGNLGAAITDWATSKVSASRSLTLYLMDHGSQNELYLDELNQERLTPETLDSWLTQLETDVPGIKINVIIEACNAGSFIQGNQSISKAGRVIITSTNVQNLAYASAGGAYFSDHFISTLWRGQHLFGGFWEAQIATRRVSPLQKPWLDADGNQIPNEISDSAVAVQRGFTQGAFDPPDPWPPYIAHVPQPLPIENRRSTIQAEVRDNKQVRRVWAVIYPPSYEPPSSGPELVPETLSTLVLQTQGEDKYSAQYPGFDETGTYRIVIHAEDGDGLQARPVAIELENGESLYLPLLAN